MQLSKKLISYCICFGALIALFLLSAFWRTGNRIPEFQTISYVRPFTFITQNNKPFTQNDMQGKVCVVNYFFTTCRSICPRMNNNMHHIYDELKDEPDFMIISHTCDPASDSAPVLKHYADSLKVDTRKWVFLTGRKDSLYMQARASYMLDDPKNNMVDIADQFLHTEFFALVDKSGNVRGRPYDGLKENDVKKLINDIRMLLSE